MKSALLFSVLVALLAVGTILSKAEAQQIPREANYYKRDLTRIIQSEWGMGGSAARAAAQIHQESGWRTEVGDGTVTSWAGAQGFAQFMPKTAEWIVEVYPDLGEAAPYSPRWAFRAMAKYDAWLFSRAQGHTHCDKWWWTLRAYNGGEGHLRREAANSADALDRHEVAKACGTARRSKTHCPENTGYPERILLRWEPLYLRNGWVGRQTCPS